MKTSCLKCIARIRRICVKLMTSAPRKPIFKVKMVGSDFTDTNEFYVPFVAERLTLFVQQVSILDKLRRRIV